MASSNETTGFHGTIYKKKMLILEERMSGLGHNLDDLSFEISFISTLQLSAQKNPLIGPRQISKHASNKQAGFSWKRGFSISFQNSLDYLLVILFYNLHCLVLYFIRFVRVFSSTVESDTESV